MGIEPTTSVLQTESYTMQSGASAGHWCDRRSNLFRCEGALMALRPLGRNHTQSFSVCQVLLTNDWAVRRDSNPLALRAPGSQPGSTNQIGLVQIVTQPGAEAGPVLGLGGDTGSRNRTSSVQRRCACHYHYIPICFTKAEGRCAPLSLLLRNRHLVCS